MLRKNKILTFALSFVLCLTLIVNCNTFRKDTEASAALVVTGAAVAITLTAEAVAALGGIIAGMGITCDSPDDLNGIITSFFQYELPPTYDEASSEIDKFKQQLSDAGFKVTTNDDTGIIIDVPDTSKGEWTYDPETGTKTFKEWRTGNWTEVTPIDGGGSSGGGGDKTPLWKRFVAGFLAGSFGLASIGNSFYDFLHNSEDVDYIQLDAGLIDTLPNIKADLNLQYISIVKQMLDVDIDRVFCTANSFDGFEYYDLYFGGPFVDGSASWYSVFVLGYNRSDNSCRLFTGGFVNRSSDRSYYSLYARSLSDLSTVSDVPYSISSGNGYKVKLSDLSLLKHYVNTSVLTEEEVNSGTTIESKPQLKIGDNVYNVSDDDNIYNNQQYVTQQLSDKVDSNGNTIVTVPQVDTSAGAITYPHYITYEGDTIVYGDTITYVNPDDVDIKEDVALDDEDVENENIFKLLYNYFSSFWTKLRQVLRDFVGDPTTLDFSGFKVTDDLKLVFPFSVPWDMLSAINLLKTEPKSPVFTFSLWAPDDDGTMFGLKLNEEDMTVTVDLTEYDAMFGFIRNFEILAFCFALILISRHLVGET